SSALASLREARRSSTDAQGSSGAVDRGGGGGRDDDVEESMGGSEDFIVANKSGGSGFGFLDIFLDVQTLKEFGAEAIRGKRAAASMKLLRESTMKGREDIQMGESPMRGQSYTLDTPRKERGEKGEVKTESHAQLLVSTATLGFQPPETMRYDPNYLDDPELKPGKQKTSITLPYFILGGLQNSIIQYSRAADEKKELDEHFRETHPNVDAMLSLSQIRDLKTRMLEVGTEQDLEFSSIASAYVFLEKLIMKNAVTKLNRRLIASVCILLAAKVNDPKETDYAKLVEVMEDVMEVSAKEIYQQEFSVYAELEFTLFVPPWEVMPHLERIIAASEYRLYILPA
ncbi:hypothetical protein HK101_004689, partial [Irineochytrium annulatum]